METEEAIIGTFEAKTHLSHLLDQVAQGRSVTITRRGKPVARLVPVDADLSRRQSVEEIFEEFRRIRERSGATPGGIKALIEEGRRR